MRAIRHMSAMAFWWNQAALECLITRRPIPSDDALTHGICNAVSLRPGSLALASLNTLVQPFSACDCTVCDTGFTNVTCFCYTRWGFSLFVLLLSWKCLPIASSVAQFFFSLFVRPYCSSVFPSALVSSCHISTSDYDPLLRCPSCWCWSISIRLSVASYRKLFSPLHLSPKSSEHFSFLHK